MTDHPLLSLIIPTKDRYVYLKHLISFIDGFETDKMEVVIQDNSADNSEFIDFMKLKERPYLRYFHEPRHIPISENVDLAIAHARGEYVCFIGDDDGVLPNIIDCVKWMKKHDIDAVNPAVVIYNWPDITTTKTADISGALFYDQFSYDIREIDPEQSLLELAARGFKHIQTIPKVYQGIVKRSCMEEIFRIGGTYTPGPSPDMATAVALSFVVKKFVQIYLPVIIVGQSQHVGGGERKLKGKVKNIEDMPFLPAKAKESWDPRIPQVWCSQTVWPESASKAIQYMNKQSQVPIDYEYILAWFIQTHPMERKRAFSLSRNKAKLLFYLCYYAIGAPLMQAYTKLRNPVSNNRSQTEGRQYAVKNMNTIAEAGNYLMDTYAEFISMKSLDK